jgi:hypothetical protein
VRRQVHGDPPTDTLAGTGQPAQCGVHCPETGCHVLPLRATDAAAVPYAVYRHFECGIVYRCEELGVTDGREYEARAAAAMRRLAHALVDHATPGPQLAGIAQRLEELAAELADAPLRERGGVRAVRRVYALDSRGSGDLTHSPLCTVCGASNPFAVDIAYELVDEPREVRATLRLGPAHEGVPGRGNGAVLAAVFEDATAHVLLFSQEAGFTGTLTIDYVAAIPVPGPVALRAWEAERTRRTVTVVGEATDEEGQIIGQARSTLVTVPFERLLPAAQL